MANIDKTWMYLRRDDPKYLEGVENFLDFAQYTLNREKIACPCMKCANRHYETRYIVKTHLIVYGIRPDYNFWCFHGETREFRNEIDVNDIEDEDDENDIDGDNNEEANIIQEINPQVENVINDEVEEISEDIYMEDIIHDLYPNPDASNTEEPVHNDEKFYKLLGESRESLYDGSKLSKASTILKLLHIKNVGQWTNSSFDLLLKLLKEEILPEHSKLPDSYYECNKFITNIGLSYEKIDACSNNCMLYRKDDEDLEHCKVCGLSRWKINESTDLVKKKVNGKFIPRKVLRYFPLTSRLQRLYMCSKTAPSMTWHKNDRDDDEIFRHPADSMTWKRFDEEYNDFAAEPRNVRLALASDGFQPFANAKTSYSMWPVILIPYNVSPTLCMDSSNFILSMLIPGPKSPGDSIDIFLQPLIDELSQLWNVGAQTFDASTSQYFNMRAALLWTINDFPAYANLSGWSTKGKLACPCCNSETVSLRLQNCRKQCYMGHRRFLPHDHRFRRNRNDFDGHTERRMAPRLMTGNEMYLQCMDLRGIILSKDESRRTKISHENRGDNWNKLSIFFDLPYWNTLLLRHNLDVMHIEKNICDSILGTIMDIKGKSKDSLNARRDLELLNIRHSLHPIDMEGVVYCPEAPFTLNSAQKKRLCQFLKDIRLPEGFCSNLSPCVDVNEKKIHGLKSHDCHILLEYLIPLATRGLFPDDVYDALVNLSKFFRVLCSKSLSSNVLDELQSDIALTLCKLEKIFPPSFFDIMVHLPVHLAFEAFLGGPVQYRWMYPIEQYMGRLKKFLRNKNFPEGSICEGYIVHESFTLCARYLEEEESSGNDSNSEATLSVFLCEEDQLSTATINTYEYGDRERAHEYILKNCSEAESIYNDYMNECNYAPVFTSSKERDRAYVHYFKVKVNEITDNSATSIDLRILGNGPTMYSKKYFSCKINGYKFNTERHDEGLTTQNSGVMVLGNDDNEDMSYYGVVEEILEVQYLAGRRVILFKCKWFDVHSGDRGIKKDKHGFISVNVSRILKNQTYEPYILATQAQQVFYVPDMTLRAEWKIVTKINPRY